MILGQAIDINGVHIERLFNSIRMGLVRVRLEDTPPLAKMAAGRALTRVFVEESTARMERRHR